MFQVTPQVASTAFANVPAPAPGPAAAPFAPLPAAPAAPATDTGGSVVDYLSGLGQPSDFTSRIKLAANYGIQNYTGTAAQNLGLLAALRSHSAGATPSQAGTLGAAVGNGQTNSLGIPTNINDVMGGSPGAPNSQTPVDLSSLAQTNPDLAPLLASGALGSLTGSQIAGLSSVLSASKAASDKYDALGSDLTTAMGSLGGESGDLQTALNAAGVPQATAQLNDLNTTVANLQGQLSAFDAETDQGNNNLTQQQIPEGLIQGQQAAYQAQRALTRSSMSAQLSAEAALVQAYQGNIDSATKLATQAVDTKYTAIQNQISVLQTQLGLAKDNLTGAQSSQANVINELLSLQSEQLKTQQDNQTKIQTLAITAASNGAPLSIVRQIQSSTDPVAAASIGSQYVGTKTAQGPQDSNTTNTFTTTQLNKGAANSGVSISDFKGLDSDSQNYFINTYGSSQLEKDIAAMGTAGGKTAQQIADDVSSSNLPDGAKKTIYTRIGAQPDSGDNSGGGFFSNAWDGIKSFLGI